jgi:calcineurin-like phosphoesterase family protein
MIFYTADIHFSDEKIREVCYRPFKSTDNMDETIILNWNNKVKQTDMVYVLGDIFPCDGKNEKRILDLINCLNGNKILVIGNHDEPFVSQMSKNGNFSEMRHIIKIRDSDYEVVLCHYPLMTWWNDDKGSIHLFGHIHNKELPEITNYYINKNAHNVGMDIWGFMPISIKEIIIGGGYHAHNN